MVKDYRPHHHKSHSSNATSLTRSALQESKNARFVALYQLLLEIFPRDRDTLLVPRLPTPSSSLDPTDYGSKDDTYILIDLSNIYIGFTKAIYARSPNFNNRNPSTISMKMDLEALDLILQRGRSCIRKILCGSHPRKNPPMAYLYHSMFDQGRSLGYEVTIMDRVAHPSNSSSSNKHPHISDYTNSSTDSETTPVITPLKEHGVDEMLSFQILEFVLSRAHKRPGTIVLTTGDGQPSFLAGGSIGFYRAVEKALANGWSVELYSFGSSLSQNWVRLRDSIAQSSLKSSKFRIIYLDEFVPDLYDENFSSYIS